MTPKFLATWSQLRTLERLSVPAPRGAGARKRKRQHTAGAAQSQTAAVATTTNHNGHLQRHGGGAITIKFKQPQTDLAHNGHKKTRLYQCGFAVVLNGTDAHVGKVRRLTNAAAAGVSKGQRLVAINGKTVEQIIRNASNQCTREQAIIQCIDTRNTVELSVRQPFA